jgi:hypothetical protein
MESEAMYSRELKRRGINLIDDLLSIAKLSQALPPRPALRLDAFYQKPPTQDVLDNIFNFQPDLERMGHIEPLWSCSDYVSNPRERKKKLIFLHVKRAGGTTIRALLRAYAYFCDASFVTIGRCENLGREFLDGEENWSNSIGKWLFSGRPCLLTWSENRSGHVLSEGVGRVSSEFLKRQEIDIVSGTLPYGCDESWVNKKGEHVNSQYVVLLRDPVTKYISEFWYENRWFNLTVSQAVALIRQKIQQEVLNGTYHNIYTKFLITPEQKSWMMFEHVPWTNERKLNLSLSNMVNQNMVVTITERLPESFVLLQYLLDADREAPKIFRYFLTPSKVEGPLGINYLNRTIDVLNELRRDALVMDQLREILKYEQKIYEWGVRVHEAQLERLVSMGWPRQIEPKMTQHDEVEVPPMEENCQNETEC